jgi:hypothetical protein
LDRDILPQSSYLNILNKTLAEIKKQSFETMVFNKLRISVADISQAGNVEISVADVLQYLEQKYKGSESDILKYFLNINQSGIRNISIGKSSSSNNYIINENERVDTNVHSKEEKSPTPKGLSKGVKEQVRNLIGNAELGKAFEILINSNITLEMKNDLILLSARYQSNKRESDLGLISSGDERQQNAIISKSLLNLLEYNY